MPSASDWLRQFECLRRLRVLWADARLSVQQFNVQQFKQIQTISNHFKQHQTISNNLKQLQTISNNLKQRQTISNNLKQLHLLRQTHIQIPANLFLVHVLTYEYQFLHTVTIGVVPIAEDSRVAKNQVLEFVWWHCGKPLSRIAQRDLLSCLLKYITSVFLVLKVAHSLATNHVFRHLAGYELVEASEVEWTARLIHESTYIIFLCFSAFVMMLVVVVMMVLVMVFVFVLMMMLVFMFFFIIVIIIVVDIFHFANPSCSSYSLVEVEKPCF